jgi:hypothetical protein
MIGVVRAAGVLAALVLLAGCATGPRPAAPPPASARVGPALVVVGVAAEPGQTRRDGARPARPPATITATWRRYDPASLRLAPGAPALVVELRCAPAGSASAAGSVPAPSTVRDCTSGRALHHVATLEAGHYALAGVAIAGPPAYLTRYHLGDTLVGSETPRFAIGAGETIYIGDHVFAWSPRPTPLLRLYWDDAAARAALRARGETDPPERRPPAFK